MTPSRLPAPSSRICAPDRLMPLDPTARAIARRLYDSVATLPIVSPHGHTDPRWYAENAAFPDPATLFVVPDHYVFRMLYAQGVRMEDLGVPTRDGTPVETDPRAIWQRFASHYHLFRGTPTRLWLDHAFAALFGLDERLSAANADAGRASTSAGRGMAECCLAAITSHVNLYRHRIQILGTGETLDKPLLSWIVSDFDGDGTVGKSICRAF